MGLMITIASAKYHFKKRIGENPNDVMEVQEKGLPS